MRRIRVVGITIIIGLSGLFAGAQGINFSNTTPAPPSGGVNVLWQNDSSNPVNVSAYVTGLAPINSPTFTGTVTVPITGLTQCLEVSSAGIISGTGAGCGSSGGGSNVQVNGGAALSTANFNGTTPAAGAGYVNGTWQVTGSTVSMEVPNTITLGNSTLTLGATTTSVAGLTISTPSLTLSGCSTTGLATTNGSGLVGCEAVPTWNQNTTGNAATASAINTTGSNNTFWGVSGGIQGWYAPPGSGTVNSSTGGYVAYYASTGTAVSGEQFVTAAQGGLGISTASATGCLSVSSGSWSIGPCYTGTVTSVAETVPSGFGISGSPITGSGTLGITYSVSAPGQIINSSGVNAAGFTASPTLGAQNSTAGGLTIAGSSSASGAITFNGSGSSPGSSVLSVNTGGTTLNLGSTNATITTTGALTVTSCSGCNGSPTVFQVNATPLSSSATVNFENSAVTNGLTLTFTNPSLGNIQLGLTGDLTVPGGGTGVTSLTGFAYGNGTSAFTAATATQLGTLAAIAGTEVVISGGVSSAMTGNPNLTWTSPTLMIGASGTAGNLTEYNNTATTTWASAATTSNTIKGFATVIANNDLFYCVVSTTICTLTDAGYAYNAIPFTDLSGNLGTSQGPSSLTGFLYDTAGTLSQASATNLGTLANIAQYAVVYSGGTSSALAGLAGNTSATPEFITSTGTGSAAQAPTLTSSTGSGNVVLATSPTLVTPALGTPASGAITNLTGTCTSCTANIAVNATTTGAVSTAATFYLPFVSSNTSGTYGLGTTGALNFNPSTGALVATVFSGSGASLSNLSASNVSSGILAPANGGNGVANTATTTLGTSNHNWATLGTGIVKNTTTTGALSDAAAADVYGLWTGTCSSSTFLRGDGACATPAGSGTVTDGSGTTTPLQFVESTSTAHVVQYRTPSQALGDMGAATANPNQTDETTSFSASCGNSYRITSGTVTVTLPGSPSSGCLISIQNVSGNTASLSGTLGTGSAYICPNYTSTVQYDGTTLNATVALPCDATVTIGSTVAFSANICSSATGSAGTPSTVSMTGLLTTMTAKFTPNSDVHTVTGWSPASGGQLYFTSWPSASGTLSYYVCNGTGSTITTGGSVTWNVSAQ